MSQITRCPSCETTFRVVPDQLRISEGWVRCGQCKNVFDASAHMLAVEPPPPLLPEIPLAGLTPPVAKAPARDSAGGVWGASLAAPPGAPAVATPPPAVTAVVPPVRPELPAEPPATLQVPEPEIPAFLAADAPLVVDQPLAVTSLNKPIVRPVERTEPAPQAAPVPGPEELPTLPMPLEAMAPVRIAESTLAPTPTPTAEVEPRRTVPVESPPSSPVVAPAAVEKVQSAPAKAPVALQSYEVEADSLPLPEVAFPMSVPAEAAAEESRPAAGGAAKASGEEVDAPDMSDVGFVRAARRAAFWHSPAMRVILAGLALGLLAVLAVQVAVHERQRLVAMEPRTQPWLQMVCNALGCDWNPVRDINGVLIDSSSFSKARGDSYVLSFALKSRAAVALETPALELTLTDAQDQAVLRRVLTPADMGAPASILAHQEWSGHLAVVVTTGGARVAGYRLLAFYP